MEKCLPRARGISMLKVSQEEVIKIAALSSIDLREQNLDVLVRQLEDVLSYAARVQEIATESDELVNKRINIFRHDSVIRSDAQQILEQAPEREQNYFVVPKIVG